MMTTKMMVIGSIDHTRKEVSETSFLSNQLWIEIPISPPMPRATNPEEKYFLHLDMIGLKWVRLLPRVKDYSADPAQAILKQY